MKAKINPGLAVSGKRSVVALAYGLTVDEFNGHFQDFVNSEGWDELGNEYDSLHEWLTSTAGYHDPTPYQKGDIGDPSIGRIG